MREPIPGRIDKASSQSPDTDVSSPLRCVVSTIPNPGNPLITRIQILTDPGSVRPLSIEYGLDRALHDDLSPPIPLHAQVAPR